MRSGGVIYRSTNLAGKARRAQEEPFLWVHMNHQFDIDHAILYGLQEAIFINNFQFWLKQNAANERNIRDGKPWTYNTHKAYVKQFPYMSENQIRRVLESLVSLGVLEKAKFNDNKYDHTLWYSFTEEYLQSNPLFDMAKKPDRSGLKPASHTDKETDKQPSRASLADPESFDKFWKAYPKKQGKAQAEKAFAKHKPDDKLLANMISAIHAQASSEQWLKGGGQFVPMPATWLNGRRWEDEGIHLGSTASVFSGAI